MKFKVKSDGSFDIYHEENLLLMNCYPGINKRAVRASRLKMNEEKTEIFMKTIYGEIILKLRETKTGAVISGEVKEQEDNIYCFHPLYRAELPGAEGVWQVSGETGNDTGFYGTKMGGEGWDIRSAGICSVRFNKKALTIFFEDFRHYDNSFQVTCKDTEVVITADIAVENIRREKLFLPELFLEVSGNIQEGLSRAAEAIAKEMKVFLDKPPSFNWCSWYYCYHNFDEALLKEYLEGFHKTVGSEKIRYFLIDAGYCTSLGDWLEGNGRWKEGLKKAFETIKEYGYRPAVWIGPYMVGNRSRLFKEHPDWILYTTDGAPVRMLITDNEPKLWDYQDEEYYVLDTSHPEAFEYMRLVFRTLKGWGAEMFKTDFMVWGLQDSAETARYCPGKTKVEYMRDFLQMIREEIGQESYWLGCIAPFYPLLGYADGMRIGGDVGSSWDGRFGPRNMIRSIAGNCFMNHVFFENDPDVVMLRDFHIRLNEKEIKGLALLQALSGGSIYTSDPLHLISEDRKKLFLFIRPSGKRRAVQPFLDQERRDVVLIQKNKEKLLLYILNPGEEELKEQYSKEELGIRRMCSILKISGEGCFGETKDDLWINLKAHGHLLLYVENDTEEKVIEKTDMPDIWAYLE